MTYSCARQPQLLRNRPQEVAVDLSRVAEFFRRRYPTGTAAAVAADLGVPTRTVEAWLSSTPREPRGVQILKCILVYGPEFLAVLLPDTPAWLSEAAQNEADQRLKDQINALKAQLKG
ncbi:hypothetical protein [uncultured Roseibium sp.]|uniref:hypothetical protein n=1 Tax=uncultured Roseibium sp. TaxID=1936171 RepID=UPI00261CC8EB|nr:hypothetical protein [uncultured Roseibium sp.]